MIKIPRRRFLIGLAGLVAAPAIVRASSLMPVKALPAPLVVYRTSLPSDEWRKIYQETIIYYGSSSPIRFSGFVNGFIDGVDIAPPHAQIESASHEAFPP